MKSLIWIVSAVLLWPAAPSWGQADPQTNEAGRVVWPLAGGTMRLEPPNGAGVTMGNWGTIVRNIEATKKFWIAMGGTPVNLGGLDVIKFHGALVLLIRGEPSGGSMGTVADHPGFQVPNGEEFLAKLKAAGVKTDPNPRNPAQGYVFSPDDLRVEILEDKSLTVPIVNHHIHFSLPASSIPEMQAWYAKLFGAQPGMRGTTPLANLPGVSLRFSTAPEAKLPTRGRALDSIGFEVKDLEAFCKKLEAMGVKFEKAYSRARYTGFASAELTDPWGTTIQLTEGLNGF
ncbi:MAG: hypothetical protein A3J28_08330 [Acidobacteria bacterium RIFCSPLOWO2_12_FULL_60_22]|nr:MAG: hypothetical protein A3J28_08330 [Acidobacteria bacterium RIFCSPLOWO2_12_FULL_60_22]